MTAQLISPNDRTCHPSSFLMGDHEREDSGVFRISLFACRLMTSPGLRGSHWRSGARVIAAIPKYGVGAAYVAEEWFAYGSGWPN